jgi:hypothetical protein
MPYNALVLSLKLIPKTANFISFPDKIVKLPHKKKQKWGQTLQMTARKFFGPQTP